MEEKKAAGTERKNWKEMEEARKGFAQSKNNGNNFKNNNRNNLNNNNPVQKPYVRCPSAMLCIKRENCDFNGVITQKTLNLTPGMVTQTINFQFAGLPGLRVMMDQLLEGTEENFFLKWGKLIYS